MKTESCNHPEGAKISDDGRWCATEHGPRRCLSYDCEFYGKKGLTAAEAAEIITKKRKEQGNGD